MQTMRGRNVQDRQVKGQNAKNKEYEVIGEMERQLNVLDLSETNDYSVYSTRLPTCTVCASSKKGAQVHEVKIHVLMLLDST